MRHAFSLVELSIVLVILGLLTGGILAGQSLIRAAELRAVSTEYARITTSAKTFRDKYFYYPGDFSAATRFWLRQVAAAHCATNSSAATNTNGACDGNANGALSRGGVAGESTETLQFWRHLQLAGLMEGTYTGVNGSGGSDHSVPNENVMASKLNRGGYSLYPTNTQPGGLTSYFQGNYGNTLFFGASNASTVTYTPILRPEEAWNIDTKMDDGKPGRGRVLAGWVTACTLGTDGTDTSVDYKLTEKGTVCHLMFPNYLF